MGSLLDRRRRAKRRRLRSALLRCLGIFFGLVLICGVFFGFGYSMGRGSRRGE